MWADDDVSSSATAAMTSLSAGPTQFETADTQYMGADILGEPRVCMPNLSFTFDASRQEATA